MELFGYQFEITDDQTNIHRLINQSQYPKSRMLLKKCTGLLDVYKDSEYVGSIAVCHFMTTGKYKYSRLIPMAVDNDEDVLYFLISMGESISYSQGYWTELIRIRWDDLRLRAIVRTLGYRMHWKSRRVWCKRVAIRRTKVKPKAEEKTNA